jgi:hypothetical protein
MIDRNLIRSLPIAVVLASLSGSLAIAIPNMRTGLWLFSLVLLFALLFGLPQVRAWRRRYKRDFSERSVRLGTYALAMFILGNGETVSRTLLLALLGLSYLTAVHLTAYGSRDNASLKISTRRVRSLLTAAPILALGVEVWRSELLGQLDAIVSPIANPGVQYQLTVIISLVIGGILFHRLFSHLIPVCLDWVIVALVAAGCSLTVFIYPQFDTIAYNYPFFVGAAQQSFIGHSFNLGVSQYGHGPQAVILLIHAISSLSFMQSLLAGTMIVNALFFATLALTVRAVAGNIGGIVAAGAVVVPALFSAGSIVSTPSVAGMRFFPIAAEVLIIATFWAVARSPNRSLAFFLFCLGTGMFAIAVSWNVDGAAMTMALAAVVAIILLGTRFWRSAILLFFSLVFGIAIGVVMSYAADPSNFFSWAEELYVVTQAYVHGLGQMPVFKFTFIDPAAVTSLWVVPILIALVCMDVILNSRRIQANDLFVLFCLFALSLIALSYFVGRAHPNNLLHVAPFTLAFVIASAGYTVRAKLFGNRHLRWPVKQKLRASRLPVRIAGSLLLLLCFSLLVAQGQDLLHRYPGHLFDRSQPSVARSPLLIEVFSGHPQTPMVMALDPDNEFAVREGAGRPNFATYGWPEQDAFGGGAVRQVERTTREMSCVLVGSELKSDRLPTTEVAAVTYAIQVFPHLVRRWVSSELWIELRSKSMSMRC